MTRPIIKLRNLMRDLLYEKYGDDWSAHDRYAGKFFSEPSDEEKALLAKLTEFAEFTRN